jgi:hypothetical protein
MSHSILGPLRARFVQLNQRVSWFAESCPQNALFPPTICGNPDGKPRQRRRCGGHPEVLGELSEIERGPPNHRVDEYKKIFEQLGTNPGARWFWQPGDELLGPAHYGAALGRLIDRLYDAGLEEDGSNDARILAATSLAHSAFKLQEKTPPLPRGIEETHAILEWVPANGCPHSFLDSRAPPGPRTASNRMVRASSAIAAGSTRWLMRRTKRPLSPTPEDRATQRSLPAV